MHHPNRALIAAREAKGYSQRQLAARVRQAGLAMGLPAPELDAVCKQIYRLERGTTIRPGDDFYLPALCAALGRLGHELFGEVPTIRATSGRGWQVISHKFIPIYIGAEHAELLAAGRRFIERTREWLTARSLRVPYPEGSCLLTLFDFGVLVAEIVEEPTFYSVAEFAVWRKTSYASAREEVTNLIQTEWPAIVAIPTYVLSTYHIAEPCWKGAELHTAMRLLCSPSALLERYDRQSADHLLATAEVAERVCFRDGFNRPDIETFGIDGVAIGYASWSGVSYLALSPARAITPDEMTSFETVVQALWCYTNMIAEVVEAGRDPVVPERYGWRFLRACHSQLTTARPRETGQHRMMKDAILNTSRLTTQLVDTQAVLREVAPFVGRR